jgi:hypothetical protein
MRSLHAVVLLASATCALAQERPQLVWEGEVDGIVILHIRGDRSDVEERAGRPVARERSRFTSRLPQRSQDIRVSVREGRGNVRVVQQPGPGNNYTAAIEIDDRQGGSDFYSVELYWDSSRGGFDAPPYQRPRGRTPSAGEERATWTGRVDGEALVECRDNQCRAQTLRGGPVTRERFEFSRPLPERDVRVSLDDMDGRGEVELIEQPSSGNGWTAKVRVRDPEGGADDYAFSLFWRPPARNEPDRLFARPGLLWSGRVDGTIRVAVQDSSVSVDTISGGPVQGERSNFTRALPRRAPNAAIRKLRGRGRVELVEFPTDRNGSRLVFEVRDNDGGADTYEVEVSW